MASGLRYELAHFWWNWLWQAPKCSCIHWENAHALLWFHPLPFSMSPPFFLSSSSQIKCIWFWRSKFQKSALEPAHFRAARQLVAVREERFQELVTAEVAYLATVPVKPVSMSQAGCSMLQSIFTWLKLTKLGTCLTTSIQVRFFSNFYISVCPEDCDMAQCGRYGPHHPERSAKEICFEDSPDRNAGWLAGWVSCLVFEVVVSTF